MLSAVQVARGRVGDEAREASVESLSLEPILLFSNSVQAANWFDKHGMPTVTIGAGRYESHTGERVRGPAGVRQRLPTGGGTGDAGDGEGVIMATLVVIDYENEVRAEEVRLALLKMQKEYLVDLIDAVIVVRDAKGKVKLRQLYDLTTAGAISGGFWGALIGLLFLNPLFGIAVGAAAGAISGALRDVGIDDNFMKSLGETLKPDSAALCVLIRQMTADKVLEEIQKFGGTLVKTNLSHENEAKLRDALASTQKAAGAAN
jgi:uncharacterized membrane protein